MSNSSISLITDDATSRFPSLASLRAAHSELLKHHRESGSTTELLAEIEEFIYWGRATGALLDTDEDRWASQSLLDYWSAILYRAEREPPDATLAEFDPALAPELDDARGPYLGLEAFREEKSNLFYGRQRLLEKLVNHLKENRLLAVIGSSGSGKSSVVLGGLLPKLKAGALSGSENWHYYSPMVPGVNPLENLARLTQSRDVNATEWLKQQVENFQKDPNHLTKLSDEFGNRPSVLVVDQFEEVFTLCRDDSVRQAFIDNLISLIQLPGVRHTVILTMRTDFESQVARVPVFKDLFEQAQVRVTALDASELREAIEKPAELVGLKFEEGLVEALLQDVLGEPAALPLLQFTLLKLWDNRERNRVIWETYKRLGGGRQALARSADEFYEQLIPEEQVTVKRILLRMVRPTEGLEVTSNRIQRKILYQAGEARDRVDRVLDKLIQARLVRLTEGNTLDDTQVEVAHEALVRNWPRLVNWLEDERVNMRQRLRLTVAAEEWNTRRRDQSALLRGALLDDALRHEDLNELETEFLRCSIRAKRKRSVSSISITAVIIVLGGLAIYAIYAFQQRQKVAVQQKVAEAQLEQAQRSKEKADAQAQVAQQKVRLAQQRLDAAQAQMQKAEQQLKQAQQRQEEAKRQAEEVARRLEQAKERQMEVIEVDATDKPLKITGWLGEENAFVGNVRLTASGEDVASFTFLPSDLKRQDTEKEITRQHVELIGEPQLRAGVPKDFQVKVNGIQSPGTYEGQIELLPSGQQRSEAVVISLIVTAKARPNLLPLADSEQVQLQLVHCRGWLDCALARLLLPASAFQNHWQLRFDNPVEAPVSLTNAEVVLEGQQTGYQITETEVEPPPSPATLAANQIISLPLKWKRSQIPPDRYTGWVYLTLDGREERLVIPVDLNMRIGPLLPLLVLLVGIVLGRLFKYMQEKGIPQSDALGKVNELEQKIAEAAPEDQRILTPMVKEVHKSFYQMDLETVTAKVEAIADRLNCLNRLRTMEQKLEPKKQHPKVGGENGILPKIAEARSLIGLSSDEKALEQAKTLLEEIQAEAVKLGTAMMGSDKQPDATMTETAQEAQKAVAAVGHAVQAEVRKAPAWPMWVVQLRRSLIFLSGVSGAVRAEVTLWVVRPLLSLVLLFGLSVVGIGALYVEKGATFGADPFADYLGLVLWGLSADVASRSLSNLPGGGEKEK